MDFQAWSSWFIGGKKVFKSVNFPQTGLVSSVGWRLACRVQTDAVRLFKSCHDALAAATAIADALRVSHGQSANPSQ
jgi:hypothetical protein